MKVFKYSIMAIAVAFGLTACTDLDEKVYDRIDASVYYQNEASVKGAVAAIYNQTSSTLAGENFFHLSEYPADQLTWRVWNGWDEAMKTVLSWQNWTSESTIIRNAWSSAWTAVGLANLLLNDLEKLNAGSLGMSDQQLQQYIAEVRTIRAWNYYCIFEIWGGALPLNTSASSEVPGTADPDWNTSCKKIYHFIATELDESNSALGIDQNNQLKNRANQAMNRLLKARLLLNAEVFIGENHYDGGNNNLLVTIGTRYITATIEVVPNPIECTGYTVKPSTVKVMDSGIGYTLIEGEDYTLTNEGGVAPGNYEVTVTGKGNYMGSQTVNYSIVGSLSSADVKLDYASAVYTGSALTPNATVKIGSMNSPHSRTLVAVFIITPLRARKMIIYDLFHR